MTYDLQTVHLALLGLAIVTTLGLIVVCLDCAIGYRSVRSLSESPPASTGPSVSIVVAARNESRHIEAAVLSLLRLDYPMLDIMVVDDRSTDETGAILERLAWQHAGLRILHVATLPDGWLGKNHALAVGAAKATGQLLLFTDADVVFDPTTLRRAITHMSERRLDHLTAIPYAEVPGIALRAVVAAFGVLLLYARPWKARDPRSRHHIGVGAFNLIRADVYRAIGTHRAIAMRPDDDMKLGKLVKKHGFRQDVVVGRDFIAVEWYASLREMIGGLMKNAFAGVGYSLFAVVGATAAMVLMNVWPAVAVFATSGMVRTLNGVSVLLITLIFWINARVNRVPLGYVLVFPAAVLLFVYILWRSALLAVLRGQIIWRGTAYPLARMRANRV